MGTVVIKALLFLMIAGHQVRGGDFYQNNTNPCPSGELNCDDRIQCINWKTWCDGTPDCADGSDEMYCRTGNPDDRKATSTLNECLTHMHFQCDNGMCIPLTGKCDDLPSCENREDEENCDFSYEDSLPGLPDDEPRDDAETLPPSTSSTSTSTSTTTTTTAKPPPPPPSSTSTTAKPAPAPPISTTTTKSPVVIHGDIPSGIPTRFETLRKSLGNAIERRDASWGWGDLTPRMVTAMFLANESYFNFNSHDGFVTKKELDLQLALDLGKWSRHPEKPPKVIELAHYVNALLATCRNPSDFYKINIIKMLKKTMAQRQSKSSFVHPLAYLALCNAEQFSDSYMPKIKNMAYRRSEEPRWLDIQANALLVLSCVTQSNSLDIDELKLLKMDVAKNLTAWQHSDGSFGTLHSTALALQALIAAEVPGTESNIGLSMTHLLMMQNSDGTYKSNLDYYYVLPALNMKSLASLRNRNCKVDPDGTQSTEGERQPTKKNLLITVHYSLWIGGERNEMQEITLRVPRRSNFLQVMAAAERMNPKYKYEIRKRTESNGLHSLAGRVSDMEKSTYWTLYRRVPLAYRTPQLANVTATENRLKLLGAKRWTKDLSTLIPKNNEHLAFWYKQEFV